MWRGIFFFFLLPLLPPLLFWSLFHPAIGAVLWKLHLVAGTWLVPWVCPSQPHPSLPPLSMGARPQPLCPPVDDGDCFLFL